MDRRTFGKRALQVTAAASLAKSCAAASFSYETAVLPERDSPGFSVMLWTLPRGLSFPQRVDVAAAAGYQCVEVGNEYEQWSATEWKTNLAALHARGILVDSAVPGRNSLADPSQHKALADDLRKAIPGAKELGCTQFIYTSYKRVAGQSPARQRQSIVDTLRYAADLLEKDRFEIVLEPIDLLEHSEEAVTGVVEAAEIVRLVGSTRVRVLYDFFHEQRQSGNLIETLERHIDVIGLVHIADVPGRHRPGTGEIHFANIYRKLAELRYRRFICMEFLPEGDPVQELAAARREAIATIRG